MDLEERWRPAGFGDATGSTVIANDTYRGAPL
jgi:hypothetical protein